MNGVTSKSALEVAPTLAQGINQVLKSGEKKNGKINDQMPRVKEVTSPQCPDHGRFVDRS
jgi:hypothetical protein